MDHFRCEHGELFCESVPLTGIARAQGTPTYVYSSAALAANYLAYAEALAGTDHLICYAVKANSNIAVLNQLARLGAGFDIVSGGELARVLAAGGDPARVVFSGVGKSAAEMAEALRAGIHCFNVESAAELERLDRVAGELGLRAPVSLRVNPDIDAGTHPYIATGLSENKFGLPIDEARACYARARAMHHIDILGVDCHIGSQLTALAPFEAALQRVLLLVAELRADGVSLRHLDLGGGLGVRYGEESPPPPADYVAALRRHTDTLGLGLLIEPGRSIAASAGVLLTRVEYLKENQGRHFAIVDAAMNDLLRPALYQAWMAIEPVTPRHDTPERRYDVVGPVCETGDFLGRDRSLRLAAGDLLCVRGAGAYGFTMSSNYNSRPRAAEVMVAGDRFHVVRDRETTADLLRGERPLPGS